MSTLKDVTASTPRPLPVIILVDVSGSMQEDGKIDALNAAMAEMLALLSAESNRRVLIETAIITFGQEGASLHQPLQPVSQLRWTNLKAAGKTPLGAALELATELLEDREQVPSRSYLPTIVLVSDGIPTGEWQQPLADLLASERGSKAIRLALAIGAEARIDILEKFVDDPELPIFQAHEARQIGQFFRHVTMSVSNRSRSNDPNAITKGGMVEDDFDY